VHFLALFSSVSVEWLTGCWGRLQNHPCCVAWSPKLYSFTQVNKLGIVPFSCRLPDFTNIPFSPKTLRPFCYGKSRQKNKETQKYCSTYTQNAWNTCTYYAKMDHICRAAKRTWQAVAPASPAGGELSTALCTNDPVAPTSARNATAHPKHVYSTNHPVATHVCTSRPDKGTAKLGHSFAFWGLVSHRLNKTQKIGPWCYSITGIGI